MYLDLAVVGAVTMNRLRLLGLIVLPLALTPSLHAADGDVQSLARRIDDRVKAAWGNGVKPAPQADDAEFFRRIHLDLAGRIPSVTEARDFLDDDRPDKRRRWIERILQAGADDPSYKDAYPGHFSNVWRTWLLARTNQANSFSQPALEAWLKHRIRTNVGYDQLVRDLLTQSPGGPGSPAVFYQANESKPENLAGSTSRLFLGVNLECAQCHNHPFAKWSRNQFWQYAAFFTDVVPPGPPGKPGPRGEIKIPETNKIAKARFLDGKEPQWQGPTGTRSTLADWMTAPDNPFFARAIVNRLWTHFFGVGLLEENGEEPHAAHKELLDELARELVSHKFDLKFLIRAITSSEAYQRTSAVSHPSQQTAHFARMPLRGLSPEQLFDSLAEATEYRDAGNFRTARGQFLSRFAGQEKNIEHQTSILQALYLMNNEFIAARTSLENNRTLATLAEQRTSTARKVESLYLVVLSRKPSPDESARFVTYVEKGGPSGNPKKALADVFWVLLNSPEFVLNH
jgi:hypothetical protein